MFASSLATIIEFEQKFSPLFFPRPFISWRLCDRREIYGEDFLYMAVKKFLKQSYFTKNPV